MNDVMEQIKTLSATLDEETTRFHPTGRLLLLGSYESVFLKAVKRKADLLGIDCDLTQYPCPPYKAVVVDRETVPSDIKLTTEVDIDHSYSQGMSSVSQATLALLLALDLVHAKDITIVGRGHAVQNLAKYLTLGNATVTVDIASTDSGGRLWYDFLERLGYYVPYEKRTKENDWYGKDMVLDNEQAKQLVDYAVKKEVYNWDGVEWIVTKALAHGNKVVINADW